MKKMVIKALFVLFFISILIPHSWASVKYSSRACYKTKYGPSRTYNVDAVFLSGEELNKVTETYRFTPYSLHIVIWWGQGKCTIIETQNPCTTGQILFNGIYKGVDQEGTLWAVQPLSRIR